MLYEKVGKHGTEVVIRWLKVDLTDFMTFSLPKGLSKKILLSISKI